MAVARPVRIASRGSPLALAQSESVRDRLAETWPDRTFEIVTIETRGDREIDRPLPEIGGKGLFTEALERAILDGDVDIAVHSLKDLPTEMAEGLTLGAITERADPRDIWVVRDGGAAGPEAAPAGTRVGTGSERRRAQLLAVAPDLAVESIRGNVETRLRKLDESLYDALIMAAAGLIRLDLLEGRRFAFLEPPEWLSAPGQGAIAVQARAGDDEVAALLEPIDDPGARAETAAERALLARLEGGCQVPVGARAEVRGDELVLWGLVGRPDGTEVVRADGRGAVENAEQLGRGVADELIERGGAAILDDIRTQSRSSS